MARRTQSLPDRSWEHLESLEPRRLMDGSVLLDDAYEQNDTPRQVLALPSESGPVLGTIQGGLTIGSLRMADRADWFRFRITEVGGADDSVAIAFRNRRGNLDLSLFNGRGRTELAVSMTNRNAESISLQGLQPGWYMVRVSGRNGALNSNYQLSFSCPSTPADNPSENGGSPTVEYNDSFDLVDAAPVGVTGSPSLGSLTGLRVLAAQTLDDTYDIYKFTIGSTPGSDAAVSISSATPFNLSLFNSGRQSIGFAAGYMGQTSLSLSGLTPGVYYLQVTHYVLGLEGSFTYDLTLNPGAGPQA